jgi:hypothetical protein
MKASLTFDTFKGFVALVIMVAIPISIAKDVAFGVADMVTEYNKPESVKIAEASQREIDQIRAEAEHDLERCDEYPFTLDQLEAGWDSYYPAQKSCVAHQSPDFYFRYK